MWSNWVCTDPDCFQHIRKNGTIFEMVETISADYICESEESDYIVVKTTIDMNNYSEEEKSEYISMYYSEEEAKKLGEDLIAECILEQEIISGDNAIFYGKFENASDFIRSIIRGNTK